MWEAPDALNIIDQSNLNQLAAIMRNCQEDNAKSSSDTYDVCSSIMDYVDYVSGQVGMDEGNVLSYNGQIFAYDWDPKEQIVEDYFSTKNDDSQTIYEAIHVTASVQDHDFSLGSGAVAEAFLPTDGMLNYGEYVVNLVNAGVPTLIYAGEYDFREGARG